MAARKPGAKKRRRLASRLLAALLICAVLAVGGMYLASRVVNVRYAQLFLSDLSPALDGVTLLFLSDIDASSAADARAAAGLMRRLQRLEPDILLLGGDYASAGLFDSLNGRDGQDPEVALRMADNRSLFLAALKDFVAPMGKFAVYSAQDVDLARLAQEMEHSGVRLLDDEVAALERDGERLFVAGLSPQGDANHVARLVTADSCVIAAVHSPDGFAGALTAEAQGGGAWADVVLAGGTHGGQILLAGRSFLPLSEREKAYLRGWRKENGVFLLTSQGVGCESLSLRLGTQAEVHLITLRRGAAREAE